MTREQFLEQEIAKYKERITRYQAMIAEWEAELGRPVATPNGPTVTPGIPTGKTATPGTDPLSMVNGMVFFNKSQTAAAEAFLQMVGYPLATSLLLEGVEKGGVKIGGKSETAK